MLRGRRLVAANLRRFRKELGLSQEALADLADLHRTYVGAIERAERNVSVDNICRLAHAVKVPPHNLLTPFDD